MAKGRYVVVGNTTHKVKKRYVVIGGVTRKIKKRYAVVGGVTKLVWSGGVAAGEVVFTSSQTWTVPEGVKTVDVFCVGGGGGTGGGYVWINTTSGYLTQGFIGSGGAGGYTTTVSNYVVTPGTTLTITVGAGGAAGTSRYNDAVSITAGAEGGVSSVYAGSTLIASANGGKGGIRNQSSNYVNGVAGGSGGGTGGRSDYYSNENGSWIYTSTCWTPGAGGSDGGDGGKTTKWSTMTGWVDSTTYGTPGKGQGTTTRYFAESGKTLYSTACVKTPSANTGQGGGGARENSNVQYDANGASGVVIIRWKEQD